MRIVYVIAGGFTAGGQVVNLQHVAALRRLGLSGLDLGHWLNRGDDRTIGAAIFGIAALGLALGAGARRTDAEIIDRAIFGLVDRSVALGARARRLQSGFIHRELALTVAGIALVIGILLAAPLYL